MKRFLIAFSACALSALATAQAQRGVAMVETRMPFESKTVKGAPYSAELVSEHVQTLSDGNRIVQRTTGRVYRDSEGRVRREEDQPSGMPTVSINDVVTRASFSLNAERREAVQVPMPALFVTTSGDQFLFTAATAGQQITELEVRKRALAAAGHGRGVPGTPAAEIGLQIERAQEELKIQQGFIAGSRDASVEEKLLDRVIGGVVATGTRRTTAITAGTIGNERPITIVSEEWSSPDLQILVMTEHSDPRTGRSTYQLSNINRNEPNPSLFQIPADYTVRRTSLRYSPGAVVPATAAPRGPAEAR